MSFIVSRLLAIRSNIARVATRRLQTVRDSRRLAASYAVVNRRTLAQRAVVAAATVVGVGCARTKACNARRLLT